MPDTPVILNPQAFAYANELLKTQYSDAIRLRSGPLDFIPQQGQIIVLPSIDTDRKRVAGSVRILIITEVSSPQEYTSGADAPTVMARQILGDYVDITVSNTGLPNLSELSRANWTVGNKLPIYLPVGEGGKSAAPSAGSYRPDGAPDFIKARQAAVTKKRQLTTFDNKALEKASVSARQGIALTQSGKVGGTLTGADRNYIRPADEILSKISDISDNEFDELVRSVGAGDLTLDRPAAIAQIKSLLLAIEERHKGIESFSVIGRLDPLLNGFGGNSESVRRVVSHLIREANGVDSTTRRTFTATNLQMLQGTSTRLGEMSQFDVVEQVLARHSLITLPENRFDPKNRLPGTWNANTSARIQNMGDAHSLFNTSSFHSTPIGFEPSLTGAQMTLDAFADIIKEFDDRGWDDYHSIRDGFAHTDGEIGISENSLVNEALGIQTHVALNDAEEKQRRIATGELIRFSDTEVNYTNRRVKQLTAAERDAARRRDPLKGDLRLSQDFQKERLLKDGGKGFVGRLPSNIIADIRGEGITDHNIEFDRQVAFVKHQVRTLDLSEIVSTIIKGNDSKVTDSVDKIAAMTQGQVEAAEDRVRAASVDNPENWKTVKTLSVPTKHLAGFATASEGVAERVVTPGYLLLQLGQLIEKDEQGNRFNTAKRLGEMLESAGVRADRGGIQYFRNMSTLNSQLKAATNKEAADRAKAEIERIKARWANNNTFDARALVGRANISRVLLETTARDVASRGDSERGIADGIQKASMVGVDNMFIGEHKDAQEGLASDALHLIRQVAEGDPRARTALTNAFKASRPEEFITALEESAVSYRGDRLEAQGVSEEDQTYQSKNHKNFREDLEDHDYNQNLASEGGSDAETDTEKLLEHYQELTQDTLDTTVLDSGFSPVEDRAHSLTIKQFLESALNKDSEEAKDFAERYAMMGDLRSGGSPNLERTLQRRGDLDRMQKRLSDALARPIEIRHDLATVKHNLQVASSSSNPDVNVISRLKAEVARLEAAHVNAPAVLTKNLYGFTVGLDGAVSIATKSQLEGALSGKEIRFFGTDINDVKKYIGSRDNREELKEFARQNHLHAQHEFEDMGNAFFQNPRRLEKALRVQEADLANRVSEATRIDTAETNLRAGASKLLAAQKLVKDYSESDDRNLTPALLKSKRESLAKARRNFQELEVERDEYVAYASQKPDLKYLQQDIAELHQKVERNRGIFTDVLAIINKSPDSLQAIGDTVGEQPLSAAAHIAAREMLRAGVLRQYGFRGNIPNGNLQPVENRPLPEISEEEKHKAFLDRLFTHPEETIETLEKLGHNGVVLKDGTKGKLTTIKDAEGAARLAFQDTNGVRAFTWNHFDKDGKQVGSTESVYTLSSLSDLDTAIYTPKKNQGLGSLETIRPDDTGIGVTRLRASDGSYRTIVGGSDVLGQQNIQNAVDFFNAPHKNVTYLDSETTGEKSIRSYAVLSQDSQNEYYTRAFYDQKKAEYLRDTGTAATQYSSDAAFEARNKGFKFKATNVLADEATQVIKAYQDLQDAVSRGDKIIAHNAGFDIGALQERTRRIEAKQTEDYEDLQRKKAKPDYVSPEKQRSELNARLKAVQDSLNVHTENYRKITTDPATANKPHLAYPSLYATTPLLRDKADIEQQLSRIPTEFKDRRDELAKASEFFDRILPAHVIDSAHLVALGMPERKNTQLQDIATGLFPNEKITQTHNALDDLKLLQRVVEEIQSRNVGKVVSGSTAPQDMTGLVMHLADRAQDPFEVTKILPADGVRRNYQIVGLRLDPEALKQGQRVYLSKESELVHELPTSFSLGHHMDTGRIQMFDLGNEYGPPTLGQVENVKAIGNRINSLVTAVPTDASMRIIRDAISDNPDRRDRHVFRGKLAAQYESLETETQRREFLASARSGISMAQADKSTPFVFGGLSTEGMSVQDLHSLHQFVSGDARGSITNEYFRKTVQLASEILQRRAEGRDKPFLEMVKALKEQGVSYSPDALKAAAQGYDALAETIAPSAKYIPRDYAGTPARTMTLSSGEKEAAATQINLHDDVNSIQAALESHADKVYVPGPLARQSRDRIDSVWSHVTRTLPELGAALPEDFKAMSEKVLAHAAENPMFGYDAVSARDYHASTEMPEDFVRALFSKATYKNEGSAQDLFQGLMGAAEREAKTTRLTAVADRAAGWTAPSNPVHVDRITPTERPFDSILSQAEDHMQGAQDIVKSIFERAAESASQINLRAAAGGIAVAGTGALLALAAVSARERDAGTMQGSASEGDEAPPPSPQEVNRLQEADLRGGRAEADADEGYRKIKISIRGVHLGLGGSSLSEEGLTALQNDVSSTLTEHLGAELDSENSRHNQGSDSSAIRPWDVAKMLGRMTGRN